MLTKRFALFFSGFLLIILIAFWGFKRNFPGESIARVLKLHLTEKTGIPFEINDFELGWTKISTPEIAIRTPKWFTRKPDIRLLVFENIESHFSSIFTSGKIIVRGLVHGGSITVSIDTFLQELIDISFQGIKLENLPLVSFIPYTSISGNLSLSYQIKNLLELQNQKTSIPEGNIKGQLENTKISLSDFTSLLELQFSELDFSEILFDIQIESLITNVKIELKGSMNGIINGSIQINEKFPHMSLIDLDLELVLSPIMKKGTKSLAPMLNSFQCGDIIKANLKGSIGKINFPTKNKC